jgi:tetratricopeptide (TPR) repeat protein
MKYVLYGGTDSVTPDLVATLLDLGKVSRDLKDDEDARFFFKSALKGLYSMYGKDAKNAQLALTLTQLGGLSYNSGLLEDAKKYFEKCLDMKYSLYGNDAVNDDLASTHNNLGSLHARLKNYSEASSFYELALDQYNRIKEQAEEGMDQNDIDSHRARTLHNLGLLSYNLKQFDDAETFYAESLKIKGDVFKDVQDSPEVALTLTKLCSVERKRGKFELAKYYQDQALKRSPTFIETHQNLFNKDLLPPTPEEAAALMALVPTDSNSEMKSMLRTLDFWREQERGDGTKMCWLPFKGPLRKKGKKKSRVFFRHR